MNSSNQIFAVVFLMMLFLIADMNSVEGQNEEIRWQISKTFRGNCSVQTKGKCKTDCLSEGFKNGYCTRRRRAGFCFCSTHDFTRGNSSVHNLV
ncbi:hypothetical protein CASFOL_023452 [Castilleja foliolosa]|uniref:Defensin n=1 Tax=Castilleja foliolosa TaxID=1961234 RepID=A0ABD3CLG3_9LAMI